MVTVTVLALINLAWRLSQFNVADATPVGIAIPVSYTHLRAHETVLDLVCRLLLEKKNTTQTYVTITL